MKHRVSDLSGALLDAAVAKAEGLTVRAIKEAAWVSAPDTENDRRPWPSAAPYWPSSDWRHGGPIIERERINLRTLIVGGWQAYGHLDTEADKDYGGPTPLIAAMRAFVASRFGEEVGLP